MSQNPKDILNLTFPLDKMISHGNRLKVGFQSHFGRHQIVFLVNQSPSHVSIFGAEAAAFVLNAQSDKGTATIFVYSETGSYKTIKVAVK